MKTQVSIGFGTGLLARRSRAVAFDPTGKHADVIDQFIAAPDDPTAVAAIKSLALSRDFSEAPLAVVSWMDGPRLLAQGPIRIRTSAEGSAMISGAGSATWVEHRVSDGVVVPDHLEVWSGASVDEATDVRDGVVRCGGFRIRLQSHADESAPAEGVPAEPRPRAEPTEAGAEAPAPAPPLAGTDWSDTTDFVPGLVDEPTEPPPAAPHDKPDEPPRQVELDEPTEPPHRSEAGDVPGETGSSASQSTPGGDFDPFVSPVEGAAPAPRPDLDESQGGASLIETALCERGHHNPPRTARCGVCGGAIGTDPDWALIEQPTVGRLSFPQGRTVGVDRTIHIGRLASEDGRSLDITIDHPNVSRHHARITVEGWAVLLTDLGSRNGTWICPQDDPTPVPLEAGVAHLLEHDTIVLLGGPDVSFVYEVDHHA